MKVHIDLKPFLNRIDSKTKELIFYENIEFVNNINPDIIIYDNGKTFDIGFWIAFDKPFQEGKIDFYEIKEGDNNL